MRRRTFLSAAALLGAVAKATEAPIEMAPKIQRALALAVRAQPQLFTAIRQHPEVFRLQIEFAYQQRGRWLQESFRRDAEWNAPASMVKLPMAIFALLRLAQLHLPRSAQLRVLDAPDCADGVTLRAPESVERVLERLLIVSDNSAFNRLYDFVGGERLPSMLRRFGLPNARLQARLGACLPEQNRRSSQARLSDHRGALLWEKAGASVDLRAPELGPPPRVGMAHKDWAGTLHSGPRDFSLSNHWRLADMHALSLAIAGVQPHPLWSALSADDQAFLRTTLGTLPREAGFAEAEFPDRWGKFLYAGDLAGRFPADLHIVNKIGQAYGFLNDSAWIQRGDRQCVLSVSIYVNADGVVNDDLYEYADIGIPFLAELGRQLIQ